MGAIELIGVDPDYQRRGISSRLMEHASEHMQRFGMDIAVVETGADSGHTPAPAVYEATGFTLLPIARYFRMLVAASSARSLTGTMTDSDAGIQIRDFREGDLDTVVAFSVRAWARPHASMRNALGDDIYLRLYPDWQLNQAETVRSSCMNEKRDVFVAIDDGRPVGFVAIALNAFWEGMGAIELIGVDPDYQRRGISSRLIEHASEHMQRCAMDIAVVETSGDPGHAPARAAYEATGFTLLPIGRYFRMLG
jgi:ribosomal protein S18 acetylase RimI-like enzyme